MGPTDEELVVAVTRVSRPAGLMFGRPSRACHLKGYGAVVVLAPRALPRVRRHAADGSEGRAFADILGRLAPRAPMTRPRPKRRASRPLLPYRPYRRCPAFPWHSPCLPLPARCRDGRSGSAKRTRKTPLADVRRAIVARARKRDLADHRAGRLSADALNARVEFDEY